jgi:hypothetical protein
MGDQFVRTGSTETVVSLRRAGASLFERAPGVKRKTPISSDIAYRRRCRLIVTLY